MMTLYGQENDALADSPGVTSEAVRRELKQILASRHFRTSKRSQQFLEYVVEQKLKGNEGLIKERLIGIEVFGRSNDYVTGDDPVVRVQAGEVRRRLERYLSDVHEEDGIRVELATGTYVPVFRLRKVEILPEGISSHAAEESLSTVDGTESGGEAEVPPASHTSPEHHFAVVKSIPTATFTPPATPDAPPANAPKLYEKRSALVLLALIIGAVLGYFLHAPQRVPSAVSKFWGPILSTQKSVVINLGKPFVYVPTGPLFEEYEKHHPGTFEKGVDRHNHPLPLDGDTPLKWSDLIPVSNSGPAVGGVRASLTLTSFLGNLGKSFTVRFGDEGSFLELRDAPSIIVGAMNNRWTSDIDSGFPFRIRDNNSYQYIEEAGTNHTWRAEYSTEGEAKDYGIITRQPVGATGKFMLKIAGLQDGGTEAASELVTNPDMLQALIPTLPANWQSKNLQILIETDVIGRKAGPPKVLAVHVW